MTNAIENYQGELPEGWTGGQPLAKWWRGKIIHLYTLRRPCAECKSEMRIDVSKAALDGTAKNAGLHLKRCVFCRARSKALGTSSRPHVDGESPRAVAEASGVVAEPMPVNEALRTANATMKAELDGLYAENKELRERLSKYELLPAMEAVANGATSAVKMPWEG